MALAQACKTTGLVGTLSVVAAKAKSSCALIMSKEIVSALIGTGDKSTLRLLLLSAPLKP